MFEKSGCEVISDAVTYSATRSVGVSSGRLDAATLLKLGQKLGVGLVCSGKADWHIRTAVTITGPKTKAICKLNMTLIDVKEKRVEIKPNLVEFASDRKLKSGELALFVLVYPYTWFSGGPKTPQMEKSLVYAIGSAVEPWMHRNTDDSIRIPAK